MKEKIFPNPFRISPNPLKIIKNIFLISLNIDFNIPKKLNFIESTKFNILVPNEKNGFFKV